MQPRTHAGRPAEGIGKSGIQPGARELPWDSEAEREFRSGSKHDEPAWHEGMGTHHAEDAYPWQWDPQAHMPLAWESEDERWLQKNHAPAQPPHEPWQSWTEEDEAWFRDCLLYPADHPYYQEPYSGSVDEWFDVEGPEWPYAASPRDWNEWWQWPCAWAQPVEPEKPEGDKAGCMGSAGLRVKHVSDLKASSSKDWDTKPEEAQAGFSGCIQEASLFIESSDLCYTSAGRDEVYAKVYAA